MVTWNQRLLPYPLLAPWTDDYECDEYKFEVVMPAAVLNEGKHINLTLKFRNASPKLRELIRQNRANYVLQVACAKTFLRSTYSLAEEDLLILDADDFVQEISLTPYIISTAPIEGLTANEHAEEWRLHKPEGFNIPAASILAVGNAYKIPLEDIHDLSSVIDLVGNRAIEDGEFSIGLDSEHIQIYVAPENKEQIEAIRRQRRQTPAFSALFPALYLHAISEALKQLSDYENTRWAYTIHSMLERKGILIEGDALKEQTLKYAQLLMGNPLGDYLSDALRDNPDGED